MSDHATTLDALRRGAAPEALSAARQAAGAQPDDATAQRLLAAALRLSGEREAALEAIDRAIDLAPDDAGLHLERAGLMLDERKLDEAQASLARSIGLDPNQFPAYIVQGQLALGRGDLDEAERLVRTAARIAPDHPHVAALEGTLAVRRGDADRGLVVLSRASEQFPDEPQLQHALAFAYLAKGHLAFAEQAFRRLLERGGTSRALRALIAELLMRQSRPADAADMLAPLIEQDPDNPALARMLGEIELHAGRHDEAAVHLRRAFAAQPGDRRALGALVEAWRRMGAQDEAREALDAALANDPQSVDLWHARLAFEPFAGDGAREVIARWQAAMPDFIPALEAQVIVHDHAGEADAAEAVSRRIVELEPGHARAELRLLDGLLRRGEPDAAVARVNELLASATDDAARQNLQGLLARTHDLAGQPDQALALWSRFNSQAAPQRLPLPPLTESPQGAGWPEPAPLPEDAQATLLLWGPPGSRVERVAMTLEATGALLSADRFGPNPPGDALQRYDTAQRLLDGSLDPQALVAGWREALAARRPGVPVEAPVVDWLLTWDNALAHALRAAWPEARLLVAVRDPRDMLLDWIAHGAPVPLALESPEAAAAWLARMCDQIADLAEQDLVPHRVLRLDDCADDPAALAQAMADALGVEVRSVPPGAFAAHFPPGHWRAYAGPLAAAFALLTPAARRLGYPEA